MANDLSRNSLPPETETVGRPANRGWAFGLVWRAVMVCGGVFLVLGVVTIWIGNGSISAGLARVQGYALVVDSFSKSIGEIPPGTKSEATFLLTNVSSTPVTILGAQTSCRCTTLSDLPLTVPPGERTELRIGVTPSPSDAGTTIRTTSLLYLDVASKRLLLHVDARVQPATESKSASLDLPVSPG